MKLLIIYSQKGRARYESAADVLDRLSLSSVSYELEGSTGERALKGLSDLWKSENPTHLLAVLADGGGDEHLLTYAAGYVAGNGKPERAVLYTSEKNALGESALIPRTGAEAELEEYLSRLREIYTGEQRIAAAQKTIVDAGLALSDASFLDTVVKGVPEFVEHYIEAGFSADTVNEKGVPALHLAVRNRQRGIFNLLLEYGADIDSVSKDNGNTPLMEGVIKQDMEVIGPLLDRGCKLNIQNKNGQTALIIAVGNGYAEIASLLVSRHADISLTDNLGMTAKKYAALFNNDAITSLFNHGLAS